MLGEERPELNGTAGSTARTWAPGCCGCAPATAVCRWTDFFVDFGRAKAHEIHLPGGDCTTEIFA